MSEEVSLQHSPLERKLQPYLEQYGEIPHKRKKIRNCNGDGNCTTIKTHNFFVNC